MPRALVTLTTVAATLSIERITIQGVQWDQAALPASVTALVEVVAGIKGTVVEVGAVEVTDVDGGAPPGDLGSGRWQPVGMTTYLWYKQGNK